MDIDTNKDGKVDLIEGVAFVQGFMSATVADVLRVVSAVSSALVLAATLWNAMHPATAAAIPTTAPIPIPAPPTHDTDAKGADTDAAKAIAPEVKP